MEKRVFVMYGESQRGVDQLFGKEWIEKHSSSDTIKEILLTKFSGLYSEEGLDEYMEEWVYEEDGVSCYSDDFGSYVYVGESLKKVVDEWIKYT